MPRAQGLGIRVSSLSLRFTLAITAQIFYYFAGCICHILRVVKGSGVSMKFAQLGDFLESLASIRFIYWIDSMIIALPPFGTDNRIPYFFGGLLCFTHRLGNGRSSVKYMPLFSVCSLLFKCVAAPWAVPEK